MLSTGRATTLRARGDSNHRPGEIGWPYLPLLGTSEPPGVYDEPVGVRGVVKVLITSHLISLRHIERVYWGSSRR